MTSAPPVHVRCDHTGMWRVHCEGDEHPLSRHGSETDAERAAIGHAARIGAEEIIVHDRYHRVRTISCARGGRSR